MKATMTDPDPLADTIALEHNGVPLNLAEDAEPTITMMTGKDKDGNESTLFLSSTYIEFNGIRYTPLDEDEVSLIYCALKSFTDNTALVELVEAVRALQTQATPESADHLAAVMTARGFDE